MIDNSVLKYALRKGLFIKEVWLFLDFLHSIHPENTKKNVTLSRYYTFNPKPNGFYGLSCKKWELLGNVISNEFQQLNILIVPYNIAFMN